MESLNAASSFFAMNAIQMAANPPSYEELESEHPILIRQLSAFSSFQTLAIISGLLTAPGFHANTVRLEALQGFVQRNSRGRAIPKKNRLEQWLNQELLHGHIGKLEDPVEDVFISNVISHRGNNRIFEGVWESNDFWAQEALDALKHISSSDWQARVMESCCALLQLSEIVARRCGLERFELGGGQVRTELVLPPYQEVLERSKFVCFSSEELLSLEISASALEPFIHSSMPATGSIGKSSLDRRPLIRDGGAILLSVPAAISVGLRLYITEQVIQNGALAEFEKALSALQASKTFVDGRIGLRGTFVESPTLPALPEGMQIAAQEIIKFDEGKYAHVLFIPDSVAAFHETQITGMLDLLLGDQKLLKYCEACAVHIASTPEFAGGMTIAVVGGLGRAFTFGQSPPPKWHALGLRLPDFLALGRIFGTDFLLLWTLHEEQAALESQGFEIANVNGELNLLGYWKRENERLIPQGAAPGTAIYVATDFLTDLRKTSRTNYDFHAVLRKNPEAWVPVRRLTADAFFKDAMRAPIFVHEHDVLKGRLRGVAETGARSWWVSARRHETNEAYNDMLYQIWDCVLQWMPKISTVAERNLNPLVEGAIEFIVDCSALESWQSHQLKDLPPEEDLEIFINLEASAVRLQMPQGFVRYFSNAKNIAERKLICGCLFGVCRLSRIRVPQERLDKLVDEIVVNDEARFFHVARSKNFRQYLGSDYARRVIFVRDGQTNFASIGLSQRILGNRDEEVNGLDHCNSFLHAVVDDSWKRIKEILLTLNLSALVEIALQNVEAIEHDKDHWRLTASALLAMHPDTEDVLRAASERDHQRSSSELASRVLVEMAICTAPLEGGRAAGKFEFGELLSLLSVLLLAANCSDAIQFGFVEPKIKIFPNGEYAIDESYIAEIIYPYIKEHFSVEFAEAAQSYGDYFVEEVSDEEDSSPVMAGIDADFVKAFHEEYGISLEDIIKAEHALGRAALSDKSLVIRRSNSQIRQILVETGLSNDSATNFLSAFSLWPRGDWDKTPRGFSQKDWYPWRFRRRLSLIARPLVQFGLHENSEVCFAPGQVEASMRLLVTRLMRGELPPEDFRSNRMRAWVGEATRRRGDRFEHEVGDELGRMSLLTLVSRPMTEFGADESYGDLDVIAWTADERWLFLIECKCLRFARTIAEIGEQLREFRGVEKDRLARHIRRCDWVSRNMGSFRKAAKIKGIPEKVIPALVTNTLVPMQFVNDLPLPSNSVVSFKKLEKWIVQRQEAG